MIYGEHKLFIKFNVIIETERLSVYTLNPKRTDRLELIKTLSDKGFNSVKISEYLNERNLQSPTSLNSNNINEVIWIRKGTVGPKK
jgi:hypothetical protein